MVKNSFTLLETIISITFLSIVIIYSTLFAKNLFFENKTNQNLEIQKIDLLSTKIFFEKHLNQIDEFSFSNENLYFQNNLLLEKVKKFSLIKEDKRTTILINLDNKIAQTWEFTQ